MIYSLSTSYALKWQHNEANEYKFTKCGKCINTKRGTEVKRIINGRSKGFCIRGKFQTLASIRSKLEPIPDIDCPF